MRGKTPNTKHQAPEKLQARRHKVRRSGWEKSLINCSSRREEALLSFPKRLEPPHAGCYGWHWFSKPLWLGCAGLGLVLAANVMLGAEDERIPPLRPAREELQASFWEQHGWWVVLGGLVALGLLVFLINWLRRPRLQPVTPPQLAARRALEALRGRTEDSALVGEVSQVLRRYLYFALDLPPEELTTTELDGMLQSSRLNNPDLGKSAADFLRWCDERKFAPASNLAAKAAEDSRSSSPQPPRLGAVVVACELIDRIEVHRQQRLEAARHEQGMTTSPAGA